MRSAGASLSSGVGAAAADDTSESTTAADTATDTAATHPKVGLASTCTRIDTSVDCSYIYIEHACKFLATALFLRRKRITLEYTRVARATVAKMFHERFFSLLSRLVIITIKTK